jgi:hypothetical protein
MAATFHLSAFADEAGGGIIEQIDALKAHKMTHIEPRGLDHGNISLYTVEQAKELKKILDDNGIGVSALGSPFGKINIADDFAPHFELFKRNVENACILGTDKIRMFSFFFNEERAKAICLLTVFTLSSSLSAISFAVNPSLRLILNISFLFGGIHSTIFSAISSISFTQDASTDSSLEFETTQSLCL